jgi:hypothetical protein
MHNTCYSGFQLTEVNCVTKQGHCGITTEFVLHASFCMCNSQLHYSYMLIVSVIKIYSSYSSYYSVLTDAMRFIQSKVGWSIVQVRYNN